MFSGRIFVTAFALFTVTTMTACPHDIAKSVTESIELTDEYNDKVRQANSLESDLRNNYDVSLGFFSILSVTKDWKSVSESKRMVIREKLNQYLSLVNRIIELSNHKAVKDKVAESDRMTQREKAHSAREWLNSLNKAEGK